MFLPGIRVKVPFCRYLLTLSCNYNGMRYVERSVITRVPRCPFDDDGFLKTIREGKGGGIV